jgi:hypothetical protein
MWTCNVCGGRLARKGAACTYCAGTTGDWATIDLPWPASRERVSGPAAERSAVPIGNARILEEEHEYQTAGLPIWAAISNPKSARPSGLPVIEPEPLPRLRSVEPARVEPTYAIQRFRQRRWLRVGKSLDRGGVALGCCRTQDDTRKSVAPLARFVPHAEGVRIFDLGGGAFRQVLEPTLLDDGDRFRVGRQLLIFRAGRLSSVGRSEGLPPRIELSRANGGKGPQIPLLGAVSFIGRDVTRAEIALVEDHVVSRLHVRLQVAGARLLLEDLNSRNGTFVSLPNGSLVRPDEVFLVGDYRFRVAVMKASPLEPNS